MSDSTNTTPNDEAARGDALPDPMLPGRAVAALREAYGATRPLPASTDAVVLRTLFEQRRRSNARRSMLRSLQIAAVFGLVATTIYVGTRNREQATTLASTDAKSAGAKKLESGTGPASSNDSPTLADVGRSRAEERARDTARGISAPAAPVQLAGLTILDAFRKAREVEQKRGRFVSSGQRVAEIDEVDSLVAQVVGTDKESLREADRGDADAIAESAKPESSKADTSRVGPTRIVAYDIKLDTGSRALAAFQVEVELSAPDTAAVTGLWLRGGDHPALQRRPYFNNHITRELKNKPGSKVRIPLANFDTGRDLPTGDMLVARVVLSVVGTGHPGVTARLVVAAGPEAVAIPASVRVVERSDEEVKKDSKPK
ncbi:MAG: hypothetical protein K2Y21_10070 [Phycisphaerales bacterium]|nr:hypothetical protein [Phycisphaerales bacterium]